MANNKIRMKEAKKIAAEKAVELVVNNMTVGLGTGSTANWAVQLIGQRVKEGLTIKAVATSSSTEQLAKKWNIPVVSFSDIEELDITIDGADEIDPGKNLIKGGGGALLREKIVAYNSKKFVVIADESKLVKVLGKFPLPVEVLPFGAEPALKQLKKLCEQATMRKTNGEYFTTDNGNYIADCRFSFIHDPHSLNTQLKSIPGVLETGLFLNTKATVIIGFQTGEVKII